MEPSGTRAPGARWNSSARVSAGRPRIGTWLFGIHPVEGARDRVHEVGVVDRSDRLGERLAELLEELAVTGMLGNHLRETAADFAAGPGRRSPIIRVAPCAILAGRAASTTQSIRRGLPMPQTNHAVVRLAPINTLPRPRDAYRGRAGVGDRGLEARPEAGGDEGVRPRPQAGGRQGFGRAREPRSNRRDAFDGGSLAGSKLNEHPA